MSRIKNKFTKLKEQNKTAFISFVTAGDPDIETSAKILENLPENGSDIIELGIPFLDPAGDGPVIDEASKRAVNNGTTLKKVLKMVVDFRQNNNETPIVLMGYFNSILSYGLEQFVINAKKSGVDGLLIVDLPIEEDDELAKYCQNHELDLIKLITPTSTKDRMEKIITKSSGFLYFVSIAGITGTKSSDPKETEKFIKQIKSLTDIPVAIGFGIKNKKNVQDMINIGVDGVVVGSALVNIVAEGLKNQVSKDNIAYKLLKKNSELSS